MTTPEITAPLIGATFGIRWPDGILARYEGTTLLEWSDTSLDAGTLWARWLREDEPEKASEDPRPSESPEHVVGSEAVVSFGHGIAVFYDQFVRIERPDYPTRWLAKPHPDTYEGFESRPTVVVSNASWSGPSGPFDLVIRFATVPYHFKGGIEVSLTTDPGCSPESVALGDTVVELEDGCAQFRGVELRRDRPVELRIRGRCIDDSHLRVGIGTRSMDEFPGLVRTVGEPQWIEMGKGRADLTVEGGWLELVRGEERLRLDGSWVGHLRAQDVLDRTTPAPELQRWVTRALRRSRVEAVEDDPEAVLAEWLRMSERERRAESTRGLPEYKLMSGGHWIVTDTEATRIRAVLPADHPLCRFATGEFVVVGPDPLSS